MGINLGELNDPVSLNQLKQEWTGCSESAFCEIVEKFTTFTQYGMLKSPEGKKVMFYQLASDDDFGGGVDIFVERSETREIEEKHPEFLWEPVSDHEEKSSVFVDRTSNQKTNTEFDFDDFPLPANIPAEKIRHELRITPTQFLQLLYDNELEVSPWPPNGLSSDAIGQYRIDIYSYEQYCERNDIVSGLLPRSHPNSPFYPPFPEDPDYSDPAEARARIEDLEAGNKRLKAQLEEFKTQESASGVGVSNKEQRAEFIDMIVKGVFLVKDNWENVPVTSKKKTDGYTEDEIRTISKLDKPRDLARSLKEAIREHGDIKIKEGSGSRSTPS